VTLSPYFSTMAIYIYNFYVNCYDKCLSDFRLVSLSLPTGGSQPPTGGSQPSDWWLSAFRLVALRLLFLPRLSFSDLKSNDILFLIRYSKTIYSDSRDTVPFKLNHTHYLDSWVVYIFSFIIGILLFLSKFISSFSSLQDGNISIVQIITYNCI